jgi:hypothetical protein
MIHIMQISATKSSSTLSPPNPVASIGQKLRLLVSKDSGKIQVSPAVSETIDRTTLDSLYRLARLLTAKDSAAVELVTGAFRRAAACGHLSGEDREQLRLHLFEALYSVLQQAEAEQTCGACEGNNRDPHLSDSVRDLIRRQDPIVRCMVFLRHYENLPLDQVAYITHHAANAVGSRLLEFRNSLKQLLGNGTSHGNVPRMSAL